MDHWKDEIKQAFAAPPPCRKSDFLRRLDPPRISVYGFLFSQIGYIRKWVWGVSVSVFLVSVLGLAFLPADVLWLVSGLTPLLALTAISESGRSQCYEMTELEMATRFSLRSVVLARLGILGAADLILLGLLLPVGLWNNSLSPFAAGLYIVTPFLLTALVGLHIVRKFPGREAMYACTGTTLCISFSVFLSHSSIPLIYQESYLVWWALGALALCVGTGKQYIAMIKRTEEFAWNLS